MSDVIIKAVNLSKIYRLYTSPHYRFLDMFGMLHKKTGAFTEHRALDHVNLEIKRGEKVAFIGRNGAGKSTLLKLATGVIEPTSGTIEVVEGASALLQIGAGFHPDFTGRENARSYLAHLGITGRPAEAKITGIIEFSELEEYIDQPIKTYSTGMVARLMFATSTAIHPKLLVLDEILGVGDAYFSHKSYERIKELCDREGTTVLLVTHDVYSAAKLCDRMIWIDRGQVLMDGPGSTVVKSYEDSIRQQEERRLRARKQDRLRELSQTLNHPSWHPTLVEIRAKNNRPQPSKVSFSRIALTTGKDTIDLPLNENGFDELAATHLVKEATCWSDVEIVDKRTTRSLLNFGSPYHKIAGVFGTPQSVSVNNKNATFLTLEYRSSEPCELICSLFISEEAIELGPLPPSFGEWVVHTYRLDNSTPAYPLRTEINPTGQYGSGAIAVVSVEPRDQFGKETFIFRHQSHFELIIHYQINKPDLCEKAQVLIAFHRNGVDDVCRVITRNLTFDSSFGTKGYIKLLLPQLPLSNGTYTLTVMVAEEGYYDLPQPVFYALNPGVYNCLTKLFEIVVTDGGVVGSGTTVVINGDWALHPIGNSLPPKQ